MKTWMVTSKRENYTNYLSPPFLTLKKKKDGKIRFSPLKLIYVLAPLNYQKLLNGPPTTKQLRFSPIR
jgi:hypothetical protein